MTEFHGYERPDGSVGVRNHLLVLAPMDCSIEPSRKIAAQVEGAVAVTQHHGCRNDPMVTNALIGSGRNPNVAGVLLVGLGCESITCEVVAEGIRPTGKPVESLVIQEEGGTLRTHEKGVEILRGMAREVAELEREPFPLSELTLAVECGGSDATSGLAANPAVGVAADTIIDEGGTVMFGETQEMTGTEHVLARRAVDDDVAGAIYAMIERQEARMRGMGIDSRSDEGDGHRQPVHVQGERGRGADHHRGEEPGGDPEGGDEADPGGSEERPGGAGRPESAGALAAGRDGLGRALRDPHGGGWGPGGGLHLR
jgi:altronate dehydratase large subunit